MNLKNFISSRIEADVASGRTLTLGDALAAGSGQTVTKSGSGTLAMGANDLTSGTLDITGGTVTASRSSGGGFDLSSGATLKVTSGVFEISNTLPASASTR